MSRQFHLFQLWFLIPGVILVVTSVYVPLSYFHKQLFWTATEALIKERRVEEKPGQPEVFYQMEFTDERGEKYQVLGDYDDSFTTGVDDDHVRIYYDPASPQNYELVNHGRYMLILFIPFSLLLLYLGWPHKEMPDPRSTRR